MRYTLAALAIAGLFTSSPAFARSAPTTSSHTYYKSSDGQTVHGPTKASENTDGKYGKATASCKDGTQSYSHHHAGTCSGHGGVSEWK